MKRRDLVRHLERHGCVLVREGAKHSRWMNLADKTRQSTVPRQHGNQRLPCTTHLQATEYSSVLIVMARSVKPENFKMMIHAAHTCGKYPLAV